MEFDLGDVACEVLYQKGGVPFVVTKLGLYLLSLLASLAALWLARKGCLVSFRCARSAWGWVAGAGEPSPACAAALSALDDDSAVYDEDGHYLFCTGLVVDFDPMARGVNFARAGHVGYGEKGWTGRDLFALLSRRERRRFVRCAIARAAAVRAKQREDANVEVAVKIGSARLKAVQAQAQQQKRA